MSRSRGHAGLVRRSLTGGAVGRMALIGSLFVGFAGIVTAALLSFGVGQAAASATVNCGTGTFTIAGSTATSLVAIAPDGNNYGAWVQNSVATPSGLPTCTIPQAPTSISGNVALNGVSCFTVSFCAAVDNDGNAYTYNGTSWAAAAGNPIDSGNKFTGVSCASLTFCVAVDNAGNAFTDNGGSWSSDDVAGSTALNAVSCFSNTFCVAVDNSGKAWVYTGTWSGTGSTVSSHAVNSVSCSALNFCMAVDNNGNAFTSATGTSWTATAGNPITTNHPLKGVACTSSTFCAAVDDSGNVYIYNGTTWTETASVSNHPFTGVSCATTNSTNYCAAVDSSGDAFVYDGTDWTTLTTWTNPVTGNALKAVSCVSASTSLNCFAVDNKGDPIFYDGASWSSSTVTVSATAAGQYVEIDDTSGNLANGASCAGTFTMELASGATNTLAVLDQKTGSHINDSVGVSTGGITLSSDCSSPDIVFPSSASYALQDVIVEGQPATGNLLDLSSDTSASLTVTANGDSTASFGLATGFPSSVIDLTQVQFSGEQTVNGAGGSETTDFVAGTTPITFTGASGANNELDLSAETPTNFTAIAVGMNSGTAHGLSSERTIPNGSTSGTTLTDPNGSFTPADVGRTVTGPGIPASTTISSFISATAVTLSQSVTTESDIAVAVLAATGDTCAAASNGEVNGVEVGEVVAWTGSSTVTDCFENIGLVNGASSVATDFEPDPTLTGTPSIVPVFAGNDTSTGASVVDLDGFPATAAPTANLNGNTSGSGEGTVTATVSSTSVTFAKFDGVDEVLGATGEGTTFKPATSTTNVDLVGQSGSDTVDLSEDSSTNFGSSASFTVAMTSTSGNCASGSGEVTSTSGSPQNIDDCFSGISTVDGAALLTDFVANASGGIHFNGASGLDNELDLSAESSLTFDGIAVGMNSGTSSGLSSGRTIPNASTSGTTLTDPNGSFTPADIGRTATGPGIPASTTISSFTSATTVTLSQSVTTESGIAVAVVAAGSNPCTSASNGEVVASTGSSTITDCFENIGLVNGASSVPTDFEPDPTLTSTPAIVPVFAGNDTSADASAIDLDRFTVAPTANLNSDTSGAGVGTVTGKPGSTTVTYAKFDGVDEVLGATTPGTSFDPGTSSTEVDFVGQSGKDAVDLSGENSTSFGTSASFMVETTASSGPCLSAGYGGVPTGVILSKNATSNIEDCFSLLSNSNATNIIKGATLPTTFQPDAIASATIEGESGSDTIDLTPDTSSAFSSFFGAGASLNVVMAGSTGTCATAGGEVDNTGTGGSILDCFSGISTVDGAPLPTTFSPNFTQPISSETFVGGDSLPDGSVLDLASFPNTISGLTAALGTDTSGGTPGSVTGDISSTALTFANFTGVNKVIGATNDGTDFQPGTAAANVYFDGQSGQDTVDLSKETTSTLGSNASFSVVMDATSGTCLSEGQVESQLGSPNNVDDCFSFVSNAAATNMVDGARIPTTFQPGPTESATFNGESGSDILDLSEETATAFSNVFGPSDTFTVAMAQTGGTCAGEGEVSDHASVLVADCFTGILTIEGAPLPTDFQPDTVKNATFVGNSSASYNTLDLTQQGSGFESFTVDMKEPTNSSSCPNEGEVTSTGSTVLGDCFSGISIVDGATSVPTTFQPSTATVTFVGQQGAGDVLDVSEASIATFSGLTVAMSGGTQPASDPCGTAVVGELTSTGQDVVNDPFCNISQVNGAASVPTTFVPDPALATDGGVIPTFVGNDSSTSPPGSIVNVSGFSSAVTNLAVLLDGDSSGNLGVVQGTVGGNPQTFAYFSGIDQEEAVLSHATTLELPSSDNKFTVDVNGDSLGSPAQVTGLSSGTNGFYGVTTIQGNQGTGGTQFSAGEVLNVSTPVDITYDGEGEGQNSLSFTPLSIGSDVLTINATNSSTDTATIGASSPGSTTIASFNSSVTQFGGCDSGTPACAGTTFDAGPGTGFVGSGTTGNTISFFALNTPTSVSESNATGTASPNISFSDVQNFVGTQTGGDTFTVGSNSGPETFTGNTSGAGASDEMNFTNDGGITLVLTSATPEEAVITGGGVGTVTAYDFSTFVGSADGSNTFDSDGLGGHTFEAAGVNNVLNLSSATHAGLTVDAAGTCSSGLPNCVTGLGSNTALSGQSGLTVSADNFSGIQTFEGSSNVATTFESSGATSQLDFEGQGSGPNTLNLQSAPQGGTGVTDNGPTAGGSGSVSFSNGNSQSFSDISAFQGSTDGDTSFVAAYAGTLLPAGDQTCTSTPSLITFTGFGKASTNSIDLSSLTPTSGSPDTISAVNTDDTVCQGTNMLETFAGIGTIDGPLSGNTTFETGQTTGYSFDAAGPNDSLSFAGVTGTSGVTVDFNTDEAFTTVGSDFFSGMASVVGSPKNDLFEAGPSQATIEGGGGTDTLTFTGATQPMSLVMSAGTATITGGYGPTITASGITTFEAPSVDGNSFTSDATGGFNFDVPGGSTGNLLSFANATGTQIVSVPSTGSGTVTGLTANDTFTNIQNFTGNGSSSEELSYKNVPVGVTFQLASQQQTVSSTTGDSIPDDLIAGFSDFFGSEAGDNVFVVPGGASGFTFTGDGSGNTLDLSQTPSGTSVNEAASQVDLGTPPGGTDAYSDIQSFIGSQQGGTSTSYEINCAGGSNFVGAGTAATITFTSTCPAGAVVINAVTGTISLPGDVSNDTFSGITNFNGPSSGSTTFVVPATGKYKFVGGNAGGAGLNTLDASALPAGTTINDQNAIGTASQDTFSNVTCFVGSSAGSTTLLAAGTTTLISKITGATGCDDPNLVATPLFEGQGTGNVLNLSSLTAGTSSSVGGISLTSESTALTASSGIGGAQVGDTITGVGIAPGTTIVETTSGLFVLSQAAQSTESSETVTLHPNIAVCMAPGTVAETPCPSLGGSLPTGGGQLQIAGAQVDNFAGVSSVVGSSGGHTTFVPANATGQSFTGQGQANTNYLSLLAAGKGTTVTTTPSVVDLDGSTTNTISFSNIASFVGSSFGSTTFTPDASSSYNFTGWQSSSPGWQGTPGATSSNVLNLSNAPAGTNVTVAATGSVTLGSAATDYFSGVSSFIGSTSGSTQFIAPDTSPAGGINFTGHGTSNSLSFANLKSVIAATGSPAQSITGANFTINLDNGTAGVPTTTSIPQVTITSGSNAVTCTNGGSNSTPCAPTNALGSTISGGGIPAGTTILASSKTANGYILTMSQNATATCNSSNSCTEAVKLVGALPVASFSDIQSITGASAADTFADGPSNTTIIDPSNQTDTLSYANATAAGNVNLVSQSASGGFGGQLTLIDESAAGGIQNVISSPRGMTVVGNNRSSKFTEGTGTNTFTLEGNASNPAGWLTTFNTQPNTPVGNNTLIFSPTKPTPIKDATTTFDLGFVTQTIPGFGTIGFSTGAEIQTLVGGSDGNDLQAGPYTTTIEGGAGANELVAGSGSDTLKGGTGPAKMIGGAGIDTMVGGKGADVFIPGTGGGSIADSEGTGTLDETRASGSVLADLGTSSFTVPSLPRSFAFSGLATHTYFDPYPPHVAAGESLPADQVTVLNPSTGKAAPAYTLSGILDIDGSTHGDIIVGSSATNVIVAGSGTNIVDGDGGSDNIKVCGGATDTGACATSTGVNTFITGSGDNRVQGSSGTDNWVDYANARSAVDVNLLSGTATKNGYGGVDTLVNIQNVIGSQNGDDVIKLGKQTGSIFAGSGSGDELTGSTAGKDFISGGDGGDTFTIQGTEDELLGGAGSDTFFTKVGPGNGYFSWINGGGGFNTAFVSCTDVLAKVGLPGGHPWQDINQLFRPSVCKSSTKTVISGGGAAKGAGGVVKTPVAHKPVPPAKTPVKSSSPGTGQVSQPVTKTDPTTTTSVGKTATPPPTRTPPTPPKVASGGGVTSREGVAVTRLSRG